jgi:hypothetical protein
MTAIAPAVRADLTPSGTLRAGVNYGNFILATKDPATGESRGVAIDLTQELGDGRFMAVQQAVGMPQGRDAGFAYLRGVVKDAQASGLVARGVSVAPVAARAAQAAQAAKAAQAG